MKNKPIIILIAILLVLSLTASVVGFLNKDKKANTPAPVVESKKPTYKYYLEDELVDTMPINDEENKYDFSKYNCENNMMVDFDTETWTYNIINETAGTCELYFVKKEYEITITATNGLINGTDASYSFKVERLTDGQFNIIPNEGYEYKETTCSNDKEALFDKSTNTLSITSISSDVACKVDFEKRNLRIDVTVKNGTGTTTEYKDYGETFAAIVQPEDGYEKPKIECTNNQEPVYENNKLTIQKVTDNTQCTVTFSKTPAVTYNLKIDNLPEEVIITAGNMEQSIISGKDGKFSLKVQDGYEIKLDCNGIQPSDVQVEENGVITYTFLGVNSNITCSVTTTQTDSGVEFGN